MIKTFNMATMPQRVKGAIKTVESIYDQADIIRIYLNGYDEIPEEFKRDKIEIYQGEDLKSTGKLFKAMTPNEYYFTMDDDIIFPPTYADDMIKTLKEHNDKAFISCGGKILKKGKKRSYFRDITLSLHALKNVSKNTFVQVIINCSGLFNTNNVKIDYTKFKYLYMDDIEVSIQLQEQKVPALVRAHKANYLIYNEPEGFTLHKKYVNKDKTQTEMVNSINWVTYTTNE